MRHPLSALAVLCLALAPIALHAPRAQAASTGSAVAPQDTARVIVQYKTGSSVMRALAARSEVPANQRIPRHAAVLSTRHGVAMTDGAPVSARSQVVFAKGMSSEKLAELLSKDSDVEFAEPDRKRRARLIPNDPLYPGNQPGTVTPTVGQWYLRAPDATNISAINAEAAWNLTQGSSGITIAVLDTGIRFDHPDLAGKTYPGYDFISDHGDGLAHANDGDGRDADASDPGDWVSDTEVNDPTGPFYHCTGPDIGGNYAGEDSTWHGTQVAGLIGAGTNNAVGMASVGWSVMVLPVRVLGKCEGYDSDIQAGMRWAAGISVPGIPNNPHPAKVINMSLGAPGACPVAYQAAINEILAQGTIIVASAGNAGLAVEAPANCQGVIAVAGVRHAGTKVGYSSLGTEVAVSAPAGNCVNTSGPCLNPLLTTTNSGVTTPGTNTYSDSFNSSLGTSFSSPLVAGTVGLMLSVHSSLTPSQSKSILQSTARGFPTSSSSSSTFCQAPTDTAQDECLCTTSTCGAGLLDTARAVAAAIKPVVTLSSSASTVASGSSVMLDSTGSSASNGRTIATYQWSLLSGSQFASLSSTTGSSTTLQAMSAGTVIVQLTLIDSAGASTSTTTSVTVTGGGSGNNSGGGGGALELGWLYALALAVGLVAGTRRSV